MSLLSIVIKDKRGNKKTYVKDYVSGFQVKRILEFGAQMESGEYNDIQALDEAVKLLVTLFKNPEVTYDSVLEGLCYDPEKGFVNTIMEEILTPLNGRDAAKKRLMSQGY